jgi:large subunit ribosomal protein L31
MKANIHPKLHEVEVVCTSCGNRFNTESTKEEIHVEVCYKCHPFYTGEHRFVDNQGRVESFQKKQQVAQKMKAVVAAKKQKKQNKEERQTKSLRELLAEG